MASAGHSLARMSIGGSPELPTVTEDIPLCLAAARVSALTALWVRGCFQHLLSKITSLWGAPWLGCLAISSWSCRPALIFLSVPSGLARGWSTVHSTHTARASVHPFCPKARGFGACCAVWGGGRCWGAWEPLARAVTEPLFRRFRWAMLAGLSFPLSRSSATLEFTGRFLWHGAPRFPARHHHPAPAPRADRARGGHGTDLSLPKPGVLVALAPQGTGEFSSDHCPQKASRESNGQLLFIKCRICRAGAGAAWGEGIAAATGPHLSPFQPWLVKPKQV